jgi:MraZ protein
MAFLGEYQHSLDPKNRVFIPAKFREALGETFVICKSPDHCLFIYSDEEWERLSEEIYALPPGKNSRQIQREIFRNADTVTPDKQGRVTVNAALCSYAGLDKDVAIVGAGKRIELWDAATWKENVSELESIDTESSDMQVHF